MRTNDLFQELLDGRIPMPRRLDRPVFYFLLTLADPTAPTVAELNAGIRITMMATDGFNLAIEAAAREDERQARNRAITEAAALAGQSFADMEAALMAFGEAAHKAATTYTAPPPKPWAGNIATQKRRRKL